MEFVDPDDSNFVVKAQPWVADTIGMIPPAAVTDSDVEPRAPDDDRESMRLLIELLAEA